MSEIRANTVSDAAGTGPATLTGQSAAKAWVNMNGTGTIAARDSFNLSSLTDNGTAVYTVNVTSSFADANHAPTVSGAAGNGRFVALALSSRVANTQDISISSSSWTIGLLNPSGVYDFDVNYMCSSSHGDLA